MSVRGRWLWGALVACVLAGAAGVGWLSSRVLLLEREAASAVARAQLEERTRAALWRMDLALARLASEESARPRERWLDAQAVVPDVAGRFVVDPSGGLRTTGRVAKGLSWMALSAAAGTLAQVRADAVVASNDVGGRADRGLAEFNLRNRYAQQNFAPDNQAPAAAMNAAPMSQAMVPAWLGEELVLVRRLDGEPQMQGSILDWQALRKRLLADVADLLPGADLVPVRSGELDRSRMLATLPARLVPAPLPVASSGRTPAAMVVALAWIALAVSLLGMVALVAGTAALSERRAAFVSAVSHELRTPLTTFRMYSEMLEAGMVPEERRQEYLRTLRVESERLGRLVENVLAYARVERGKVKAPAKPMELAEAFARIVPRLADRAAVAGMELVAPEPMGLAALIEPTALEQVLFNLVENACKYAAPSSDKRIHLEARRVGARVEIAVRDHGPGIAADVRGRLFTPFAKSAQQAADSAPGVGLGLALSRRLARAMGGELSLSRHAEGGACFVLALKPVTNP